MKKILLLFVTLFTITLTNAQQAVGTEFTVGDFIYRVTGDGTTVTLLSKVTPETVISGAVVIPATISDGAFNYSISLIESAPFNDEAGITSIVVEGDTEIKFQAFRALTSLTTVDISAIATAKVGNSAFINCTALKTANVSNLTNAGTNMFKGCTALESVDLTNATVIGNNMFHNCISLTSIDAPAATFIDNLAFYLCANLTQINIPVVETIKTGAFNTTGITSLTLPASLVTIDETNYNMFKNITSLTSLTLLGETPLVLTYDSADGVNTIFEPELFNNVTLTVPEGAGAAYFAADVWKNFSTITEASSLSVDSKEQELGWSFYPNPTTDVVSIKNSKLVNAAITVYDLNGRALLSKTINSVESEVNISNLHSGIYLFNVTTDTGAFVKRIVKQ
ncbi:leucine-rich repeat domain-containing protein [Flavivirga jejuensis]|uniref:Leucine-rich repeat domain-containing protein n=1 Tax=Flavivirga jejuensis TaxID=870487 RepID=A0ABT8WJZ5_9FLAO|nr:leucine-rich repeat domain-containing protein [Flavivirga jejuensis]MDO5973487.1 leucine-rich repeat domain-containing protein [Flavivirga jejuensis]